MGFYRGTGEGDARQFVSMSIKKPIFIIIVFMGYLCSLSAQYVHNLYPCRDSSGTRIQGCFAWSDSAGQYIQVTDTFYCDGDNLIFEYRAVNNAWGYHQGELVNSETILGVCAGGSGGSTDDQLLSTNGTPGNISIESGNTITLNVDDADSDPNNEIQDISGIATNTQAIQDTAAQIRADFPVDTDTNDIDSTRLLQDSILVYYFNGSETGRDTIAGTGGGGTDSQTLSFISPNLSISNGNTVDLTPLQDGTGTDDQAISIDSTGRIFSITLEDGGSVVFEDTDTTIPNTDEQTLSIDGSNNLIISNGNQVSLSAYLDDTTIPDDQTLAIDSTGRVFTVTIADGNSIVFEDTNTQLNEAQVESFIDGDEPSFSGWDKNESDDFSGAWGDLTSVPAGFSDNIDNVDDADSDPTNEIQDISGIATNQQAIIDTASQIRADFPIDTDTQLSESEVVQIVRDTGFLESYTETDPIWIADSSNYASKSYTDQSEQDAKDYADANDDVNDADADATNEGSLSVLAGTADNAIIRSNTSGSSDITIQEGANIVITESGNTITIDAPSAGSGTDDQTISIDSTGRVFTITLEDGGAVTFEDTDTTIPNTDDQTLSLVTNSLSIENGNSVDLSGYLDNTDEQDLSLTGNTLAISGDPNTDVDLSGYLDNTDAQTLSIDGSDNLIISGGNQVSLSAYLDDTTIPDDQTLAIDSTGRVFALTIADGNTVNFEDTNTQLNESQVEAFIDGNETSFSGWDKNAADDFDSAWSSLTGVPAGFADNTDDVDDADNDPNNEIQDISGIATNEQAIQDTAAQIRADFPVDTDTQLSESEVVQIVRDTGFLESYTETDPIWISDSSSYATKIYADQAEQDAKDYADLNDDVNDADANATNEIQDLELTGNTLSLTDDATTVDLSGYLDNTDAQTLSFTSPNLSITNGNTVDLSALQDGTGTDDQTISIDSTGRVFTITLESGGSVTFEDTDTTIPNTDDQTLSIDGSNNLIISDGNQVSLSPYLDDTTIPDDQTIDTLQLTGTNLEISLDSDGEPLQTVDLSSLQDGTGTDDQQVDQFELVGNNLTFQLESDGQAAHTVDLSGYLDDTTIPDDQTLSWNGTTGVITIADGNSIDIDGRYLQSEVDGSTSNELQTLSWSAGTGGNDEITLSDGGGTVTITDDNTQLSNEQVQDIVGGMVTGNTETLINVTYDDAANEFDFIVEDDLSLYDNSTSGFLTTEIDGSFTNEGSLSVGAGTSTTSLIQSNTSGSPQITLSAGSNVTITESGNTITISATASTDGDGIYDGNGTTPLNTTVTMTDEVTFQRSGDKIIVTNHGAAPADNPSGDGAKLVLQDNDSNTEGSIVFQNSVLDVDASIFKRSTTNVGLIFEEENGTFRFEDNGNNNRTSIRIGDFNNSQNAEIRFEDSGSDVVINHNQTSGQFIIENQSAEWFKIDHSDGTIYFPQYTSSKLTTSKTGRYVQIIEPTTGEMFLIEPDSIGGSGGGTGTDDQNIQNSSFNSSTGTLQIGIENGSGQSFSLDGRYLQSEVDGSTTNELQDISGSSWNSGTGVLTIGIESGANETVDLDGRYVEDVNDEGIDINDYTPTNGGSITVNFENQARKIIEINTTNITSGFTMNVSNGWNTAGSAGVYNIRFFNSTANQRTVTLDATDTWYDEKGTSISTITLESNEDKILTMYTENGSTWYTME